MYIHLTACKQIKLAEAQNPILSSCTLFVYPCLNQGEWVSLLVNSQHKLESVMGDRTCKKQKLQMSFSNKREKKRVNLSMFDSENEAANFPKYIVLESLKETSRAKLSPFLIEKIIQPEQLL